MLTQAQTEALYHSVINEAVESITDDLRCSLAELNGYCREITGLEFQLGHGDSVVPSLRDLWQKAGERPVVKNDGPPEFRWANSRWERWKSGMGGGYFPVRF